jgi:hypothetical protein
MPARDMHAHEMRVCEMHVYEVHACEMHVYETLWGLPGVYSTIWCLCYKTNKLEKKKQKERRWACLQEKGLAFVAGWRERGARVGWAIAFHPPRHLGGTACVLALYTGKRRCLRHCRRLDRAPARHIHIPEMHACDVHAHEVHAYEMHNCEVHASKIHAMGYTP